MHTVPCSLTDSAATTWNIIWVSQLRRYRFTHGKAHKIAKKHCRWQGIILTNDGAFFQKCTISHHFGCFEQRVYTEILIPMESKYPALHDSSLQSRYFPKSAVVQQFLDIYVPPFRICFGIAQTVQLITSTYADADDLFRWQLSES